MYDFDYVKCLVVKKSEGYFGRDYTSLDISLLKMCDDDDI